MGIVISWLKESIAAIRQAGRWIIGKRKEFTNVATMAKEKRSKKEAWETLSFAWFLLYCLMYTVFGYFLCWIIFIWIYSIAVMMVFILGETLVNIIFIPLLYLCIGILYVCKYLFWALIVLLALTMIYWLLLWLMPGIFGPIHQKIKSWWINRKSKAKTTAAGVVEPEVVK